MSTAVAERIVLRVAALARGYAGGELAAMSIDDAERTVLHVRPGEVSAVQAIKEIKQCARYATLNFSRAHADGADEIAVTLPSTSEVRTRALGEAHSHCAVRLLAHCAVALLLLAVGVLLGDQGAQASRGGAAP
jgi:hypothetical protein